jgi:hypothetical protein
LLEKLLIDADSCPLGLHNAYKACGYNLYLWSEKQKPAFDIFAEFQPTVFISNAKKLSRATLKCLLNHRPIKTVVSAHCQDIEYLKQNFCELFIYNVSLAADTTLYHFGKENPNLQCDVAYVGKRNDIIYEFLTKKCYDGQRNIKIFGPDPWPVPNYLGNISIENECDLYASAKFRLGENYYKILACGFSNDCLNNLQEMHDIVNTYKNNTYFNRIYDIMSLLNIETKMVEDKISEQERVAIDYCNNLQSR